MRPIQLLDELTQTIENLEFSSISHGRRKTLESLIEYLRSKRKRDEDIHLNFICTHNSRRSQFAQIWAQTAADYFGIDVKCYSGGVEVTAFNERAVTALKNAGFKITPKGDKNPVYFVLNSDEGTPISCFSKLYDDPINKANGFAAVMTCSHADENCPFIPGTEKRISIQYEDPKAFDDTPLEAVKYEERSMQIATEMFYAFSQLKD